MCELLLLCGIALSSCGTILALFWEGGGGALLWLVVWLVYLSLFHTGQVFLSYQWDTLLLEAGALAVLLAPLRPSASSPPSAPLLWVARWLLFKLMFMSGIVKIQAQCDTWLDLSALNYHFATQCLPSPLAWYMHQLPEEVLRWGVVAVLWLEGPAALLLLSPIRGPRILAATLQIMFQVLIMLSGNYGFFNLLTIVLAMLHFDDDTWAWVARRRRDAAPLVQTSSKLPSSPSSGQALAAWHRSTGRPCVNHDEVYASVADRKAVEAACAKREKEAMLATRAAAGPKGWPLRVHALLLLAKRVVSLLLITAAGWGFLKMFRFGHGLERIELAFTVRDLDDFLGNYLALAIQLFGYGLLPFAGLSHLAEEVRRSKSWATAFGRGSAAAVALVVALSVFTISAAPLAQLHPGATAGLPLAVPPTLQAWMQQVPVSNGYGLFRRMTGVGASGEVARPEVVIEASMGDGMWREYHFRYKPGDPTTQPQYVAPHQPRLDWQMWFAALGTYNHNPWFVHLCYKLLEGSPAVLNLLDTARLPHPPGERPLKLRALLYTYTYTPLPPVADRSVNASALSWWTRTFKAEYLPEVNLDNDSILRFLARHRWSSTTPTPPQPEGPLAVYATILVEAAREYPAGMLGTLLAGVVLAGVVLAAEHVLSALMLEALLMELKPKQA